MRNHSPARVNAFTAYATGGAHAFTSAAHRRSGSHTPALGEESSEAGPSALNPLNPLGSAADNDSNEDSEGEKGVSFGERLRAGKDDDDDQDSEEKKLNLTEQEGGFLPVPDLNCECS